MEAGLTLDDAAEALGCHRSKVSRLENGKQHAFVDDIATLLTAYGHPELVEPFGALAQDAEYANNVRHSFPTLPSAYTDVIALESTAESVRVYAPQVVPGLLQTSDYAQLITAGVMPGKSRQEVAALVKIRQDRQVVLSRPVRPLVYWAIIEESVLLRRFPGRQDAMRGQLQRLLDAADMPNVTIQVMSVEAPPHPGVAGGFDLISFPPPMPPGGDVGGDNAVPDLTKLETLKGSSHLHAPEDVTLWHAAWGEISKAALSASDSRMLIEQLLREGPT
jgi:transcriptional regulator with XRE-family HTH domain